MRPEVEGGRALDSHAANRDTAETLGPRHYWARRLSRIAPIFLGPGVPAAPLGPASILGARLDNRRAWSFVVPSHTWENPGVRAEALAAHQIHLAQAPAHHVFFLCSTAAEVLALQRESVRAIFGHHNLLVRDAVFAPDPTTPKDFDAIYVGQMSPFKRHWLAREVPRLALVYYPRDRTLSDIESVRLALPRATFVNAEVAATHPARPAHGRAGELINRVLAERGYASLPPPAVAVYCNRARVGLCLSAEEGAMYASMEYLLCGLPVVTTPSRGGRDFFFDPEYTLTVPADPRAVRDAVAALIARAIPPETIRATVLARLAHERARLQALLGAAFDEAGAWDEFPAAWERLFTGPIWQWHTTDSLLSDRHPG